MARVRGFALARVLLLLALGIAVYLAWGSFQGGSLPGCGPESACDKVLQSRWSHWLGFPVAVPAVLVYGALLWATFAVGRTTSPAALRLGWSAIAVLALVMSGAAFWFVGLQAFVLKSFCPFCMTAHVSAVVAGLLLIRKVPLQSANPAIQTRRNELPWVMSRAAAAKLALSGGVVLAVMVAGQVFVEKSSHTVKTLEGPAVVEPAKKPARELLLHGGRHRLLVNDLPIIGSPEAPHVIVSLFDYTCHYCRDLHGLLLEAQRTFTQQLAILSLPMPLDSNCNHLVKRTPGAHANACQYAKLGLAVWHARREAFSEFDSWLFHPPSPPSVDEVRKFAEQLVGPEKLAQALTNDWVKNQIETSVAIYDSNRRELNDGRMPQLIIGSAISPGPLGNIRQLYQMLAEQLGLKKGP